MEDRRGSLPLDVTILSLLALAAVLSGCSNVTLAPGHPSAVIQEQNTLVTAIPITNQGKTGAESVHVTSVSVKNGAQTIPGKLISGPSSIGVGAHAPAYATFPSTSLLPGNTYTMQVQGTYLVGSALRNFAFQTPLVIAPGSPGSAPVSFASSPATRVSGAPYPPQPPNFPPEVNEGTFWTVPTGPEHPLTRTLKETTIQPAPQPGVDPPLVEIFTNEPLNLTGNSINEPSGAASTAGANSSGGPDGVVFETFNSSAAFSTNRGSTWTQVNPTTIFPNTADGGFCCDQIVQYAPTIDRFIWVMQFLVVGYLESQGTGKGLTGVAQWSHAKPY